MALLKSSTPLHQEGIFASACRRHLLESRVVRSLVLLLLLLAATLAAGQSLFPRSPLEQHCALREIERHRLERTVERLNREQAVLLRQLAEARAKLHALSGIEQSMERNSTTEAPL